MKRRIARQGSADPAAHVRERGLEADVPPMEEKRLGQVPPREP